MVIGLAVVSTSVAGVQYDMARQSVHAGDLERAERSLGGALALDPGMALYWRQRETVGPGWRDPSEPYHAPRSRRY